MAPLYSLWYKQEEDACAVASLETEGARTGTGLTEDAAEVLLHRGIGDAAEVLLHRGIVAVSRGG